MNYFAVEQLEATGLVVTVMTSEGHGCWLSNNPDGHAGYREVAAHYGITAEQHMTGTFQRHTTVIDAVNRSHAGRNVIWREAEPKSADGIVTNEPGLMLCSMESDCPPVFLLDPVQKAIGMVHSGWKGTAGQITGKAVQRMTREYGTRPADLLAAFGPCICRDCYEVGEELMAPFADTYSPEEIRVMFRPKDNGKYSLDLLYAIRRTLEREGVPNGQIYDTCCCTFHQNTFYSHRRQLRAGLPGTDNMFTGIMLKE